jgi:hypothetical protein
VTIARTHGRARLVPRVDRVAWRCGLVCGAVATYIFGILVATRRVAWDRSDVPLFEGVARSPFGAGRHLSADPSLFGIAYRYGRVLYPLFAWLLAAGQGPLIRPALGVVFFGTVVVAGAAAAEIARRSGRSARAGMLVFAVPFTVVWAGTGVLTSEPLVLALVLLALLAEADGDVRRTRDLASLALLAREAALIPLLALPIRAARRDGLRATARSWWWVPVPYAVWATWVRVRVGDFPFTDPSLSRRDATAWPVAGFVRAWRWNWGAMRLGVVVCVATVIVAVVVIARFSIHSSIGLAAALSSASVVALGPFALGWLGECLRVLQPTHSLLALLIVTRGRELAAFSRPRAAPASAR